MYVDPAPEGCRCEGCVRFDKACALKAMHGLLVWLLCNGCTDAGPELTFWQGWYG